jgi:hypothetical protein
VNTHFRVQRFEGVEESNSGEWKGGILVDMEVRLSLTILGFRELENQKPCNEIHEITKWEVPKGKKDLCGANYW